MAASFHIISAHELLGMNRMERHQDVRDKVQWLKKDKPLALIFVSHRWETLLHPDLSGRQFRALHEFLIRIGLCIEAMCVDKQERLQLVPTVMKEGSLQAEEVARRILGFGPFSDDGSVCIEARKAKTTVKEKFAQFGHSRYVHFLVRLQSININKQTSGKRLRTGDEKLRGAPTPRCIVILSISECHKS